MRRSPTPTALRPGHLRLGAASLAALVALTVSLTVTAPLAGARVAHRAQTDDTTVQAGDTVQTTSTLPVDNRELGNSLPRPNKGMEPQSPGDPGGFLQSSLFFLICGAVVIIGLLVWRSSRIARRRRTAAGLDPVQLARARGEGVRHSATVPPSDPPPASDAP